MDRDRPHFPQCEQSLPEIGTQSDLCNIDVAGQTHNFGVAPNRGLGHLVTRPTGS